ncbi:alpha/beta hydrolase [Cruoricaptor ignavus]|uniref:Alpha/beta hydrolase n=1 Tax=Cruoricaptor ignavus TaxID=1118202 RepID=A0A7M1T227_9FLAO|nr:alpha/beta hydrolase-fold protein [Cruoricaptor ignavus]QOR73918.1 alpha/beta hydrolase [Cruoricaptor ignavus]
MIFELTTLPGDSRPVFLTGNFCDWHPRLPANQLLQIADDRYKIEIPDENLPEKIEYKYSRGGWENVELDAEGKITSNRKCRKAEGSRQDLVENWRYNWGPFKQEFFPICEVISEEFYMPQLDRTRKVWALLPHNYYETEKRYPVLYLHDAQNLFNEGSPYGNWEIDKKLSILAEYGRGDIIVIAVDHGKEARISEYIFDNDAVSNGSEGKRYIRFITDTLKPFVDANFRTLKEREFTGIGGSSLGGLISIYSGFLYPEVYSKLMIFSPSLWVEPRNNFPMVGFRKPFDLKMYIYGGEREGSRMVARIKRFVKTMQRWEYKNFFKMDVKVSINPEGEHNEFYWSQEFPAAVEWLYFDSLEDPKDLAESAATEHQK